MFETDIRKWKKKKEMNEEREENIKGSGRRNRQLREKDEMNEKRKTKV